MELGSAKIFARRSGGRGALQVVMVHLHILVYFRRATPERPAGPPTFGAETQLRVSPRAASI